MTFTELRFWWLAAIAYVFWLIWRRSYGRRIAVLIIASVVFYGYHLWRLLPLIASYCVVDWAAALWLARSSRPRLGLSLGVAFNLGVLGYWKYTPLLLRTARGLGVPISVPAITEWEIPFGISFYAFTGIAYLVDVYRSQVSADKNFWRYTLSAIFFPHLVAGPILRPNEFLTRLTPEQMPECSSAHLEALFLVARGLFRKMVLADRIADAIDPFFAHVAAPATAGVWSLPYIYLYALQIYFDFSGYTDIARGLGLLFGFRWPENFNRPYLAASVQEFWQRWHITLSRFLRDYLYIPLGGSRQGPLRTSINLLITMLLGGLWHGASWSFMIWGGLHGLYLVVHRAWSRSRWRSLLPTTGLPVLVIRLAAVALTFHCVVFAWCFFRLTVFSASLVCIEKAFVFEPGKMFFGGTHDLSLGLLLTAYGLLAWLASSARRWPWLLDTPARLALLPALRGFLWGFAAGLLILAVLLSPQGERPPFIYFQF
jgi:D-alanyl-lipoteichoic acid acyltransferase DltB (MBOAT superfamily)